MAKESKETYIISPKVGKTYFQHVCIELTWDSALRCLRSTKSLKELANGNEQLLANLRSFVERSTRLDFVEV